MLQDSPVSLSKEAFKEALTAHCRENDCGYDKSRHGTFPVVFIGDKFIGGNSDWQAWVVEALSRGEL